MFQQMTPQQREVKRQAEEDQAFLRFKENEQTKLMTSLIPANDSHPETLEILLKSAFKAGASHATGSVMGDIIEAMLSSPRKDRDRPF